MTIRPKVSEHPELDAAEYLSNEENIAAYLTTVIEENDPGLLPPAQEDITRAREGSQSIKVVMQKETTATVLASMPNVGEDTDFARVTYATRDEDISASGLLTTKSALTSIKLELAEIKSEQKLMNWILGLLLAGIVLLIFKAFF